MLAGLILLACAPEEAPSFVSMDVQVDGAPKDAMPSRSPRLCVSGGEVSVAWSDDRAGSPGVWLNRSDDDGATWLPEVSRADEGYGNAQAPTIACQPGATLVAWEDTRDGDLETPNIYARSSMSGGQSWLAASARLGDDEWGWFESHGARAATAGRNVYVVWQDARYGAYDILFSASYDFGATWNPAVRLDWNEAGAAWSGNPTIVADTDGRVHVAWEDRRNGETDIYVTSSHDFGVTWTDDFRVDTGDEKGAFASTGPALALDGETVSLVWSDARDGEFQDILLNTSTDGGATWLDPAVRVDSDAPGESDSVEPQILIAGGVTHVVWRENRFTAYDIYYRRGAGSSFGTREVPLDTYTGDAAHSFEPRLVSNGMDVVVAWADERHSLDGGNTDLFYTWSEDAGVTWPAESFRINSLAGGTAWSHDLAVALAEGQLYATWADDRNGDDDLWFTHLALGASAETPEGAP